MNASWKTYLEAHREQYVQDLQELVRIPSITGHREEVRKASAWIADRLRRSGMEHVEILETDGNPVVYGDWLHAPGKPTVLIYGHIDVQPADPVASWTTPPFDPVIRDGRMYGRGVGDMKGNVMLQLAVLDAWLQATGSLPLNVKVLYEGEEEIGSASLPDFVAQHKSLLACDFVLDSDSGHSAESPSLTIGCRGGCTLEIQVRSANTDIHSGMVGGGIPNALHSLIHIMDTMHAPDGRVAVEGFYDDVQPVRETHREILRLASDGQMDILRKFGIKGFFGEPDYTPMERMTLRPTLEVVGMSGGHTGDGLRGIVPSQATAKLMCRLTAGQSPEDILAKIQAHVRRVAPAEVDVHMKELSGRTPAYLANLDHPVQQAARQVMTDFYGVPPKYQFIGATLPVMSIFHHHLGVDTICIGADGMNAHAPDESYPLQRFFDVQKLCGEFLERAAGISLDD